MRKLKLIKLLFPLIAALITLGGLAPALVHADSTNRQGDIFIKLNPARTDVTVTAQRQAPSGGPMTVTLKYNSSKSDWESGDIQGTQTDQYGGCSEIDALKFVVTVKDRSGAPIGHSPALFAGCGTQATATINVTSSSPGTGSGSNGGIQGRLSIYDPIINKVALEYPRITSITLKSLTAGKPDGKVNKSYSNAGDSTGNYVIPIVDGVPAAKNGTVYLFEAQGGYTDPNEQANTRVLDIVDSVLILPGKVDTLNLTEDFTDFSHPKTELTTDAQKEIDAAKKAASCNAGLGSTNCNPAPQDPNSVPSCENTGFSLAWFMCKVIDGLADAVNGIYTGLIEPMLVTPGIDNNSDAAKHLKAAWSTFRIMADVFLVIALLVVVFGESIGGGMIDAYTVKKVLPRIVIGAVLINISYYLVAAAVDISNIVGQGIGELITAPFHLSDVSGNFKFDLSGQSSGAAFTGLTLGGTALTAAGIAGLFAIAGPSIGTTLTMLLYTVLLPMLAIVIAIMVTLALRVGLIFALVLASPLAFAAYVLPNTEKYFKKWWELLQELLLVYPIITVMFALSQVVAQTQIWSSTGNAGWSNKIFSFFIALIIIMIPLAAIPFAFKLAGGVLGRIHELAHTNNRRISSLIGGDDKDPNSRKNRARQKFQDERLLARERAYDRLNQGGATSRFMARRMGGHNLKAGISAYNARRMKEMEDQKNTGDDTEQRALSVNENMLNADWRAQHAVEGTDWRMGTNGQRQYRTLGGAWVDESAVQAAYARWGNDVAAQQWSLSYEMTKAATQEEQDYLANNFGRLVGTGRDDPNASWRMSKGQQIGLWKGAAFAKQNENRQWKHYSVGADGNVTMGTPQALSLFREIDEKQGNYAMMQQSADTWTTMASAMEGARNLLTSGGGTATERAQAQEILDRGARIAFATQSGSYAEPTGEGDETRPVPAAAVAAGRGGRTVGAGAAGRVQEEMVRFVQMADRVAAGYQPPTEIRENPAVPIGPAAAGAPSASDTVWERRGDRTGPGAPGGTGTGGVGPRTQN